jgi:hypothetical protein
MEVPRRTFENGSGEPATLALAPPKVARFLHLGGRK